MHTTKRALVAITFLGLAGLSTAALAQNTTFPGGLCHEADDTNPEILYNNGRAYNGNGTYDAEFECPITRPNAELGGSITDLFVRVDDSHSAEAVECRMWSCNSLGTTCSSSSFVASSGQSNQTLSLGSVTTFTNGFAYVSCEVPDMEESNNHSGVISYRAND